MNHIIICQFCHKEFTSRKNKKFCTSDCYTKSRDKTVILTCKICSGSFTKPYRFRETKTCSRECLSQSISIEKRTSVKKNCVACNKEFDVNQSAKDQTQFCSYSCHLSVRKTRQPPIKLRCENCKKQFLVSAARPPGQKFCSKSCARSGVFNARFGKIGTMTGRIPWTKGLTKKTDERIRIAGEKISVIISNKIINGEWKHCTGFKGEHFTGVKNGGIETYLRSSYESKYARILDASTDVISWKHEPLRIPYCFEGSIHNYIPDFLIEKVDGTRLLVEVKPKSLSDSNINLLKSSAALSWCSANGFTFLTVTEEDIINSRAS